MTTTESKSSPIATKAALSDLSEKGVKDISTDLRKLLADVFALYVKTKNFHWHMTGPNFRDYHRLLDDHGEQIFAMSDARCGADSRASIDGGRFDVAQIAATLPETATTLLVEHMEALYKAIASVKNRAKFDRYIHHSVPAPIREYKIWDGV